MPRGRCCRSRAGGRCAPAGDAPLPERMPVLVHSATTADGSPSRDLSEPSPSGRAVTPEDLFRFCLVSDPRVSPDGSLVAYVVTRLDQESDDYRAAIWIVPVSGGEPRQLTAGLARDTTPRWSPDGAQLAFVSNRPADTDPAGENDDGASEQPGAKPKNQ